MSVLSGFIKTIKYRLTDAGYKWQSEKTSSQTVVMGDGTDNTDTVESRFGNIQGITSSLATDNENYALSASAGKDLQDQITDVNSNLAIGTLFKCVKTTASLTLTGNETKSIAIKPKEVNGYVPITIMGVAVANVYLEFNEFYLNAINGLVVICLYNRNSTSQTASITLTMLYVKSI